jgi:hypothetical protein
VDTVDTAGELGFVVAPGLRSVRWWLWCATTPTLYHATPCSLTASARAICSVTMAVQESYFFFAGGFVTARRLRPEKLPFLS